MMHSTGAVTWAWPDLVQEVAVVVLSIDSIGMAVAGVVDGLVLDREAAVALVGLVSVAVACSSIVVLACQLLVVVMEVLVLVLTCELLVVAIEAMDGVTALALHWPWPCTAWWQARPPVGLLCVVASLALAVLCCGSLDALAGFRRVLAAPVLGY